MFVLDRSKRAITYNGKVISVFSGYSSNALDELKPVVEKLNRATKNIPLSKTTFTTNQYGQLLVNGQVIGSSGNANQALADIQSLQKDIGGIAAGIEDISRPGIVTNLQGQDVDTKTGRVLTQAERLASLELSQKRDLTVTGTQTPPMAQDISQLELRSRMPVLDIPFKAGLSESQQNSIRRLQKKPVAQWTAIDKKNWNFATNNAPLGQLVNTTPPEGVILQRGVDEAGQPPPPTGLFAPSVFSPAQPAAPGVTFAGPGGPTPITTTPIEPPKPSFFDDSKVPDSMKNSAEWKNATEEQRGFATFIYNALNEQDIERQLAAKKALEDAIKISDPYFKQQLQLATDELDAQIKNELATNKLKREQLEARMKQIDESVITATARLDIAEAERQFQERESLRVVLDEAMRSKKSTEEQAASDVGKLQTRIDQIKTDLEYNRGELSIEEQADLARQMRQYEVQLENTQGQLVEAGLTYSTRRAVAEQRLKEELQDVSMSTRRQFARQQRELAFGSERGIQQAQTGIQDTTRQAAERLASLQRGTERVVGSSRLPTGFEGIGGLRGTLGTQSEAERLRLSQQREDVLTGAKQQKRDVGFGLAGTLEGERQRLEQIAREREVKTGDIERQRSEDVRQAYMNFLREQELLRTRV